MHLLRVKRREEAKKIDKVARAWRAGDYSIMIHTSITSTIAAWYEILFAPVCFLKCYSVNTSYNTDNVKII